MVLGIWEGIAYMCLKSANDLFDRLSMDQTVPENRSTDHWIFWYDSTACFSASKTTYFLRSRTLYCRRFGCSTAIPMIIIIVVWVRKSYRRFPTTQIFPLELGALTIVSVNGGLIFFEEYAGKLDTNERCHRSAANLTLRTMCQRCLSTRPTAEWGGWTGC